MEGEPRRRPVLRISAVNLCRSRLLTVPIVVVLSAVAHVDAQCLYDFELIYGDPCDPGTEIAIGTALNDNGDVVGFYYPCQGGSPERPFVWTRKGGYQKLPALGMPINGPMSAQDINDKGVIVGGVALSGIGSRGYVLENGEYTILQPVVDIPAASLSAYGINDEGVVVGKRSIEASYNPRNAFLWTRDGGFLDLGLMGYTETVAVHAPENGLVAGWTQGPNSTGEVFVWSDGTLELLGIPEGAIAITGGGVGADRIAGRSLSLTDEGDYDVNPLAWTKARGWSTLGMHPEWELGSAADVSEGRNEIVGFVTQKNMTGFHAVVWYDSIPFLLSELVPALPEGSMLQRARAVNRHGQIVVEALLPSPIGHGTILLTPIDRSPADVNGDCVADTRDLLHILSAWGTAMVAPDLDHDGEVGSDDVVFLLDNWTVD